MIPASRMASTLVLLCVSLLAVDGGVASAQATPGVLAGTVRDQDGRPIENALVALDPQGSRRSVRTDAEGRFRFDRMGRGGRVELVTIWIGYRTDIRTVEVGPDGADVAIVLERNLSLIDTMHVVARQTGIHGTVIAEETFTPLADAEVQVIGVNTTVKTRADGKFVFGAVRPGAWVVHVKRSGYQGRFLSVTAPKDSAVELSLVLARSDNSADRQLSVALGEFDRRRRWMGGTTSTLVPRHELWGHMSGSLRDALRYSLSYVLKGLVVDDSTCVFVDGVFQPGMMVDDFRAIDVEAVEVYGTGADFTNTVTDRPGIPASRKTAGGMCGKQAQQRRATASDIEARRGQGRMMTPPRPDRRRVESIVIWMKR